MFVNYKITVPDYVKHFWMKNITVVKKKKSVCELLNYSFWLCKTLLNAKYNCCENKISLWTINYSIWLCKTLCEAKISLWTIHQVKSPSASFYSVLRDELRRSVNSGSVRVGCSCYLNRKVLKFETRKCSWFENRKSDPALKVWNCSLRLC